MYAAELQAQMNLQLNTYMNMNFYHKNLSFPYFLQSKSISLTYVKKFSRFNTFKMSKNFK